jgi:hypothetical protein
MVGQETTTTLELKRRSCGCDYVDLKKKRVGYPSVMHFEGRLAFGSDDICNFIADFIQQT